MGWEETGVDDLNDIPNYHQVHWKFFNAFFKAFQERMYYTIHGERPAFFDDLILDGPQIGRVELETRLRLFNNAVQASWNSLKDITGEPIGIMSEQWLKVETWDEFGSFTESLEADLVDEVFWGYDDIRAYLTPDVFDLILNFYEFKNNFNTTYWSGIYKLINLMEYNRLHISIFEAPTGVDPDQVIPFLHCNDREEFPETGSNSLDLDELILESINNSFITIGQGTQTITSGYASFKTFHWNHGGGGTGAQSFVDYDGMFSNPYVITPLQMGIRTKIRVREEDQGKDSELGSFETSQAYSEITPILSTKFENIENGTPDPIVYIPDQATYLASRYKNMNLTVNHNPMTGKNDLDISSVPDIRITETVDRTPVEDGGDFFVEYSKLRRQDNFFVLEKAISKIPLSSLEYGPQL